MAAFFSNLFKTVSDFFVGAWDKVSSFCVDAWNKVSTFCVDAWDKVSTFCVDAWGKTVAFHNDSVVPFCLNAWDKTVAFHDGSVVPFCLDAWDKTVAFCTEFVSFKLNLFGFEIPFWYIGVFIGAELIVIIALIAAAASKKGKKKASKNGKKAAKQEKAPAREEESVLLAGDLLAPVEPHAEPDVVMNVQRKPAVEEQKRPLPDFTAKRRLFYIDEEEEATEAVEKIAYEDKFVIPETIKEVPVDNEEVLVEEKEPIVEEEIAEEDAGFSTKAVSTTQAVRRRADSDRLGNGKITFVRNDADGITFVLKADDKVLFESRPYKSMPSAYSGAADFIDAVSLGMFSMRRDHFGKYKFLLRSPSQTGVTYIGREYFNDEACLPDIEDVCLYAVDADVDKSELNDNEIETVDFALSEELIRDVEKGVGISGKWQIVKTEPKKKTTSFVFLLSDEAGNVLFESDDYRTASGCAKGIETFQKTLLGGRYTIIPTVDGFRTVIHSAVSANTVFFGRAYEDREDCIRETILLYAYGLLTKQD